jgi:hypothetical protein
MKKWYKNLKLMVGAATMLGVMAAAPVAHGGLLWTGIDPIVKTERHTMNIWVEWPTGRECSITGPIAVTVRAHGQLVSESTESFNCPSGAKTIATATTINAYGDEDDFKVSRTFVPAADYFPVAVKVYKNGTLRQTCTGLSNLAFGCATIELDDDDDDDDDD